MPLKISEDERKLMLAVHEQRLMEVQEEEIKQVLRYCFSLVGLRAHNIPAGAEKELLLGYIRAHYGGHTAAEVRMAFDLAITGQLDVNAECYENFSIAYFARIMNAYRSWASDRMRAVEQKIDLQQPAPPTPEELKRIDDEYRDALMTHAFREFCKINKLPVKL